MRVELEEQEGNDEGQAPQRRADHRILKQSEAGLKTTEMCHQSSISEQTFLRWKAKYGGLEASDAKRLRHLEDENRQLKQAVAELTLDNHILRDVNSKNF